MDKPSYMVIVLETLALLPYRFRIFIWRNSSFMPCHPRYCLPVFMGAVFLVLAKLSQPEMKQKRRRRGGGEVILIN